jgi:hypothetical protein
MLTRSRLAGGTACGDARSDEPGRNRDGPAVSGCNGSQPRSVTITSRSFTKTGTRMSEKVVRKKAWPAALAVAMACRTPTTNWAASTQPGIARGAGDLRRPVLIPSSAGSQPLPAARIRPIHQVRQACAALRDVNAGSSRTPFRHRSPDPHHLAVLARPSFVRDRPLLLIGVRERTPDARIRSPRLGRDSERVPSCSGSAGFQEHLVPQPHVPASRSVEYLIGKARALHVLR